MDWAEWLGLFTDTPVDDQGTLLDSVAALMLAKMSYGPGERDMLLMQHTFRAEYPDGSSDAITSTMLDYGIPDGDSSMARTVSLPAAIATRLVLEGRITHRGVCIPVLSEIYDPLLDELEDIGIRLEEEWTSAR
jgi:saccharopine dehydrogenase-like NADP-dependent oxidoreductase